ncbi:major head protein [Gordonia phage UmaThurman]|uniref:major head protein n=1 Tax=Gordonia phage CaptainKirk2 TaxID=1887643 RepID=UPI00078CECC5|nr:major head protein [Gordonia phage CaptainKirk2]YP_009302842.1 major head protein [Gordonia phage UmaThurman]YP_009304120.1 major head protein [Gordonia phage Guacamole]QBG78481.1 major capsid protein [Gordonia phage Barco]QDB74510.1 major capsid protein [Gordonia phage Melba]QDH85327.1 major capsid protein [Gordonia phage MintFen]QDK02220.1 major capsid protein [Gordonia phage Samba]QDM56743.1 major capsid protein [Gordonia phage JasperJr]QGH77926.1 major capsid protein [Gordonia phage 
MANTLVSVSDGPSLTVSDLVKNPLWVPTKLKELMENQFISEALLRNGGKNDAGVVAFREGDPTFLDDDVQDVAEFGEIPVSAGRLGLPRAAYATKKALGVRISKEMIDENKIDAVNKQITGLRNTFVRANDRGAKALFSSPAVPTMPVSEPWDDPLGKPRTDLAKAIEEISTATPDEATEDEYYGFEPDTIVLHPGLLATLMDNEQILKVYQGNVANESIAYTGAIPGLLMGLNVIKSRTFPVDKALILERGTVGFYSDTRPLQFTTLYAEGGGPNGGPRETWRSDASHKRAIGLDQPKAALWLTGLVA